jgi:hypothetical protein
MTKHRATPTTDPDKPRVQMPVDPTAGTDAALPGHERRDPTRGTSADHPELREPDPTAGWTAASRHPAASEAGRS